MQLSLLDQLRPQADAAFRTARRIELDESSWVEHVPDWVSGHNELLTLLLETAEWEQHRRTMYDRIVDVPRLVAGVPGSGESFQYAEGEVLRFPARASRARIEQAADLLAEMGALLSLRYRCLLESVTLAHYRDGKDSVAPHGDKMGPLRSDTVIAIVSVGARRKFLLRPAAHHEDAGRASARRSFLFGGGDLLVMGGACQRDFEHAVPKMAGAGKRIAIMFRQRVPEIRKVEAKPSVSSLQSRASASARRGLIRGA